MAFLPALSSFAQGVGQGYSQGQQIKERALAIQKAQMELDAAKKQTAADLAAFAGIAGGSPNGMPAPQGGQQPPPTANPMPPGAPSQPMDPPGGAPPGPTTQPAQPPVGGANPPAPAQTPPGGGAALAPAASPGGGGSSPQGQPGPFDPANPMAGRNILRQMAQEINANPQTASLPNDVKLDVLQRIIDMSKGLQPAVRQAATVEIQQARDATSIQNTNARDATSMANTAARDTTSTANTQTRAKVAERGQDIGLQKAREQAGAAMQRVQAVQNSITTRFASGQGNQLQKTALTERTKQITAQLTAATRQLATLKDAAGQPLPDTDPRVQKATRDIAQASAKLDVLEKAVNTPQAAPGSAGAQGGAPGAGAATATDAKGNKIQWDGKAWVPVPK
jgi:hypothetical protein